MLWRLSRVTWGVEQEKAGLLLHADKVDFGSTMDPREEEGRGRERGREEARQWHESGQ